MTTAASAEGLAPVAGPIRKTKWSVVWLLTLTLFSALTVGGLLAPLQEAAKADLGMTDMQLSLLVGAALAIPVALFSLPIAWMVDRGNRKRLLIVLTSLWALGTIGCAFAPNFEGLFAARLIAGIGAGTGFPVVVSLLADVCMPDRRGRSMLLMSIGAWGGAAAAYAIGGTLFGYLEANPTALFPGLAPWRETHLLVGIGAALGILPLFLMKEPERHEVEQTNVKLMPSLRAFWKRRRFLGPLLLGNLAGGLADVAAGMWVGSVLIRHYNQAPGAFGGWVGLIILASGVLGSIIGGFSADAGLKMKLRGGILLPALIATGLTIPAGLYPIMPTVSGFAWVLFALLVGGTIVNLVNSAAIAVLIPNEERAMSLAFLKMASTFVTFLAMPPIIVWMSHVIGGENALGQALAWLGVITGIVSLIGYWLAMVNAPDPVAKVEVADAFADSLG